MKKPLSSRQARMTLAAFLAVVAIGVIVAEPFPAGAVLVSLTTTHGIDSGDLPALVLLLVAGWLVI